MKTSFSQKVLARLKSRKEAKTAKALNMLRLALLIFFVAVIGFSVFLHWRDGRPTWASFQAAGGAKMVQDVQLEFTNVTDDGVPSDVWVNGEHWNIVNAANFVDTKDGTPAAITMAQTYCKNKVISYMTTKNMSEMRVTLYHELFHAGACAHGGDTWWNSEDPTALKHAGVYNIGDFLGEFTLANPQFMVWMATNKWLAWQQINSLDGSK